MFFSANEELEQRLGSMPRAGGAGEVGNLFGALERQLPVGVDESGLP
jgi:hypothetical protein